MVSLSVLEARIIYVIIHLGKFFTTISDEGMLGNYKVRGVPGRRPRNTKRERQIVIPALEVCKPD